MTTTNANVSKPKRKPSWKFGVKIGVGIVCRVHKNGRPYYFPIQSIAE